MLLLSRLRTSLNPARCLVTVAHPQISQSSIPCGLYKQSCFNENTEILTQQQDSRRPWEWQVVNYSSAQVDKAHVCKAQVGKAQVGKAQVGKAQVGNASLTSNPMRHNPIFSRSQGGLFGKGRQGFSACFKSHPVPLPRHCPAHYQPAAGYCSVPPEFEYPLPRTRLGHTFTIDLSPSDQDKLKTIAHEELKTVLKDSKINYKQAERTKPSPNSLNEIAAHDLKEGMITPDLQVPKKLKMLFHYISEHCDTENIFTRDSEPTTVKSLMVELEKSNDSNYSIPETYSTQDMTTAVKTLLNGLPVRLMTTENVDEFPDISAASEEIQRKALNLFILSMNQPHRDTLHLLIRTLHMIDKKQDKSHMNSDTLAPIIGPILFKMPDKLSEQEQAEKWAQFSELARNLIRFNIRHFYVEQDLLAQLRGSGGKGKSGFKLPWQKEVKKGGDEKVTEIDQLKVSAPTMPKTSLDIQINPKTLAIDIVDDYRDICKKDGPVPLSCIKNCLFEVGGNIGERCLDPFTFIMDVYQNNPAAQFVIRPSTLKGYSVFHFFL